MALVCSMPLLRGGVTFADDADYDTVCALLSRLNSKGYIMYSYTEKGKRRHVCLHRLAQWGMFRALPDGGDALHDLVENGGW